MKREITRIGSLNSGEAGLSSLQSIVTQFMLSELENKKKVEFKMPPKIKDNKGTLMYEYYMNGELFCCIKTDDEQYYVLESYISINNLIKDSGGITSDTLNS